MSLRSFPSNDGDMGIVVTWTLSGEVKWCGESTPHPTRLTPRCRFDSVWTGGSGVPAGGLFEVFGHGRAGVGDTGLGCSTDEAQGRL